MSDDIFVQSKEKIYFDNLDALRFLAFLSVFLFHFFNYISFDCSLIPILKLIKINLIDKGFLGVNFFFVLSGFLITYLLLNEKGIYGHINIGKFYARRFFRIWPLFFVVVFLGFFVFPYLSEHFSSVEIKEHILYYFLFINNFDLIYNKFEGFGNGLLGGLWSIAIEEQYYLLWPFIIYNLKFKSFIIVILLLLVFSLVFRIYYINHDEVLYFHTLSVINDLLIGSLVAYLIFFNYMLETIIKSLSGIAIAVIYLLGFLYIYFNKSIVEIFIFNYLDRLIISSFFVFIILEQVFSEKSFFKLGQIKKFNFLGKISYGLYMLHLISIMAIQKINVVFSISVYGSPIIYFTEMLASLSIAIIISWLSYNYFEKVFLDIKNKFYGSYITNKAK
jgi:peptidoglycan/LPS O-acetylase OafA/YrhL